MNSKAFLLPAALMIAGNTAANAKGKKSDQRPNILVNSCQMTLAIPIWECYGK